MQLNLTKKQYWNLMRAVYMADWMANAIVAGGAEQDARIKEIRNYIFSFAKEMGYEEYVGHDKNIGYHAEFALDDEPSTRALIKRYDEHTMWEELIEMLAERDFHRRYSKEDISAMTHDERVDKFWEIEGRWSEEFEKYGVERLTVGKTEKGI